MSSISPSAKSEWLKLADYGDWPHSAGLQRLTRTAATEMARSFQTLLARLRRRFAGVPIYIGHPDDPGFAGQPGHTDTRAHAWVSDLAARDDGLYVRPRWSDSGRELLRQAHYKFLSPRWLMRPLANGVYEPIRLLSVGLTNHPNIPGEAVANQAPVPVLVEESSATTTAVEATTQEAELPEAAATGVEKSETLFSALLAALELEAGAAPEVLLANAEQLAVAARETRDAQTESARFYRLATDAEAARLAAERRAEEERAARVELLLDAAEWRAHMAPNERAQWRESLQRDFDDALRALGKVTKPVALANHAHSATARPTASVLTANLAARRPAVTAKSDSTRLLTLVNERMARTGEDYPAAFARVKRADPAFGVE